MEEESKIKVYIKINDKNEVTEINSEIFIRDLTGWIYVDEGFGDKFAHAQGHYLDEPLMNDEGEYNYIYLENKIQKKGVK